MTSETIGSRLLRAQEAALAQGLKSASALGLVEGVRMRCGGNSTLLSRRDQGADTCANLPGSAAAAAAVRTALPEQELGSPAAAASVGSSS